MKQVENRHLTDVWAVLVQGHGRIIAPDFYVAHREANSGLSTLNRTKSILSIYHQQRQLHNQRGMCLNDTYPFCQQPLSGNCHSICFSKPVLWTATPRRSFYHKSAPQSGALLLSYSCGSGFFSSASNRCSSAIISSKAAKSALSTASWAARNCSANTVFMFR